jgi:hypothetical protein
MGRDSWEPVEQPLMIPPMTTTGLIATNKQRFGSCAMRRTLKS